MRTSVGLGLVLAGSLVGCGGAPPAAEFVDIAVHRGDTHAVEPPAPRPRIAADAGTHRHHDGGADAAADAGPSQQELDRQRTTEAIRVAINAHHQEMARCYEEALRAMPDAIGRVRIELKFKGDNSVQTVAVAYDDTARFPDSFRPCVTNVMHSVQPSGVRAGGWTARRAFVFVNPPVDIHVVGPLNVPAPANIGAPRRPAHGDGGTPNPFPVVERDPDAGAIIASGPPPTESDITPLFSQHVNDFQTCYAEALRENHAAAGSFVLGFDYGPDGYLTAYAATDVTPGLEPAAQCAVNIVRSIHFRPSGTGASVHYQINMNR